ncbi:hypothetical protein DDZ13_07575 [Coraliomargarita sinensis]|uniref:Methane oxygenase PmoA n=1 Tax=Coraliomargarita sinensis TaxID=2174842 RepID=A0A317ZJI9_9BACT|nr:PmoA family protein [Coraliomargarita sinensis]PXA04383.1 hypothetical protein DDZ13_07575 [Coraliomargarita sinensis]
MKRLKIIYLIACLLCGTLRAEPPVEVITSPDATTLQYDGKVLWTYHHDASEGKPYFHPLKTTKGALLTELRPKDHVWHRGLWFSWKYLNGVNYWEENKATGRSDGSTRLLATRKRIDESQRVTIEQRLDYAPTEDGPGLLEEARQLVITPPNTSGVYTIDWSSDFRALEDVVLDRTPVPGEPKGKQYGGYAGLSIRLAKSLTGGTFLTRDQAIDGGGIQGYKAQWMSFNSSQGASVLIMEHPESFRVPTTWYVAPMMPFFSPAVLFDAPYTMREGESFSLRYRLVVSPEAITADHVSSIYPEWSSE